MITREEALQILAEIKIDEAGIVNVAWKFANLAYQRGLEDAAIDYNPANYEEILGKEPLYTHAQPAPDLQAELVDEYKTWFADKPPTTLHTEIELLQAENKRLQTLSAIAEQYGISGFADIEALTTELTAVTKQRDELQKDAERYRWLRDNDWQTEGVLEIFWKTHDFEHSTGKELDEAIDEAIANTKCRHNWVRDQEAITYSCCQKCGEVKRDTGTEVKS